MATQFSWRLQATCQCGMIAGDVVLERLRLRDVWRGCYDGVVEWRLHSCVICSVIVTCGNATAFA